MSSLLAIKSGLIAACCGADSVRGALGGGTPAVRAHLDLRSGLGGCPGRGVRRQLVILQRSGLIARRGRQIAVVSNGIASIPHLDTQLGSLVAFSGAAIAKITRRVVDAGVAALREVAIAGRLVRVGRSLVAIGRRLVAVSPRLISILEALIAIGERLIVVDRPRSPAGAALPLCLDRPVPRIQGTFV